MASLVDRRHWYSRNGPRAFALLVWAAFGIGLLVNSVIWSPVKLAFTAPPKPKAAIEKPVISDDELYTGSIVFVPSFGEYCWERMLDNRTGVMWDKGYVDCYEAVQGARGPHSTMSGERMLAIGKALRRGGN